MITRFAPSPTGHLHLGHAYSALVAYEASSFSGGQFLLRFEDIDHTRVREKYYSEITQDLHWLGITWNAPPIRQLDRLPAYQHAIDTLKSLGVLYPCFCTRREIEAELAHLASAPHGPEGPLYPGTCRNLTPKKISQLLKTREPAWRLHSQNAHALTGDLSFLDLLHGPTSVNPTLLGDLILARKDLGTSYHLAVVVDDAWQEITHVTRGEDLLPSTHIHRTLQTLLKLPKPHYLHHPLLVDQTGKRLAKRHDSLALSSMRHAGLTPSQVCQFDLPSPQELAKLTCAES